MSFTRAAEELHVTPGAISRQIRTLEDILGFALFDRNHREVRLSAESKAYVASLSDSFRQMERATRRLVDQHREEPLHIHAAITFTLRWLVPRLNAFHARHPKQQIRLSTALPDADELAASNDVSLRLGPFGDPAGTSPALTNHYLFDIDLVPVCSPSLLRQGALDTDPQAFAGHTLLRSHARPHDWNTWLAAAGINGVDPQAGFSFESSSLAYQAAVEGIGIAMGMYELVEADVLAGRLVIPHGYCHPTNTGLHLVYATSAASTRRVADFRDWMVEIAASGRKVSLRQ